MRVLSMNDLPEIEAEIQKVSETNEVVVVGVAGGSCSGKSLISCILANALKGAILPMDDYYRGIESMKDGNFDKPDALDSRLLKEHIAELRKGKAIRKPVYDFKTHARSGYETFRPAKTTIVEGLFALHHLYSELDVKIFVEADMKTRLKRRTKRDVKERGRTVASVMKQFSEIVQPMHIKYVEPGKKKADYVIVNN